jgi:hypothetical protein
MRSRTRKAERRHAVNRIFAGELADDEAGAYASAPEPNEAEPARGESLAPRNTLSRAGFPNAAVSRLRVRQPPSQS